MPPIFRPFRVFRWILRKRIWVGDGSGNTVYLTFDDGPTEELTTYILEQLRAYNAKATFFCVGENSSRLDHLMEAIRNEGHLIGNHTFSHENGMKTERSQYLASVKKADQTTSSFLFRPPYGRLPVGLGRKLAKKYRIVMWSWLSYDFDHSIPIEHVLTKAEKQLKAGDIIVLHDNVKVNERLRELLPGILRILDAKGLRSDVISV